MHIPKTYRELLKGKGPSVLSVLAKDGNIHSSLVWTDLEGDIVSIGMFNTAPKFKRLVRNSKATVLKSDPDDEDKYISLRCSLLRVESEGAIEHIDKLTQRHYGKEHWYGDVVPDDDQEKQKEVIVYLKPEKIYYT